MSVFRDNDINYLILDIYGLTGRKPFDSSIILNILHI